MVKSEMALPVTATELRSYWLISARIAKIRILSQHNKNKLLLIRH